MIANQNQFASESSSRLSASVLCVDDNPEVREALKISLGRAGWRVSGWLADADQLAQEVAAAQAGVVILDVNMPGRNPFKVASDLSLAFPDVRIVFYTSDLRPELVDLAVDAGGWGFAYKGDGEAALIRVLERVICGEFSFTPSVEALYS